MLVDEAPLSARRRQSRRPRGQASNHDALDGGDFCRLLTALYPPGGSDIYGLARPGDARGAAPCECASRTKRALRRMEKGLPGAGASIAGSKSGYEPLSRLRCAGAGVS
jgi:hypothetical protein